MFLCPKCCSDKNISELQQLWSVESYGECEGCGKTTCCVDVKHKEAKPYKYGVDVYLTGD